MTDIGRNLFVTGIDTGVGKTLVAAILAQGLRADYWKPIQCGDLEASDTQQVQALVSYREFRVHPEAFRFEAAKSPHQAAALAGKMISLADFNLPGSKRRLIVEGAGGALVPLNDREWIIDLAVRLALEVVVVTKNYLGSLNHTFLTLEALQQRGLKVAGLVFNGPSNPELEAFIARRAGLPILLRVGHEAQLDCHNVARYAQQLPKGL